jgi:sugar phosphate isomerase/epimerase
MKLACQENLIPGETALEKWRYIEPLGFAGIELRGTSDLGLKKRLPELREAKRQGAVFSSVCVSMGNFIGDLDPETRRDAVTNLKSQLSVIAELGGTGVVTPASYGKFSRVLQRLASPASPEEHQRIVADSLAEAGEHAQREGVVVLLEPLNRYEDNTVNTLAQASALCEATGQGSVKVMADLYHMNIEEDDTPTAIRESGNYLAHVHICDSNRHEPGCGHIDFKAACEALQAIGYDGYLALECRLRAPVADALRGTVDVLRAAMR